MSTKIIDNLSPDVIVAGRPCYTRSALANALGKSEQTIAGWSTRKFGPPYLLIGRRVVYPQDEVLKWLDSKLVKPERGLQTANADNELCLRTLRFGSLRKSHFQEDGLMKYDLPGIEKWLLSQSGLD